MGQTSSRTHHTGRARETVRGVAREAHVGLSTGCARFSEGAKRLTIGEVQLCRRKQSHMRSQGLAVAFRCQPSCTAALDFDHFQDVDSTPTKQTSHLASSPHFPGPRGFPTACWGCPRRDPEGPELKSTRLRRRPRQAARWQGARSVRFALPAVPCERSHSTPGPVAVGFEVV